MRLREPFQGYKLAQGHFMFHMAFLLGSYIACYHILNPKDWEKEDRIVKGVKAGAVLNQLNCAHILVPLFNLFRMIADHYGYNAIEKLLEIASIA